jgi:aspartate racemase
MKTAGIIGGIGPASTIEYYRLIIASYREQKRDGSYPQLIINSIDLNRMRSLIEANNLPEVTEYLLREIRKLGEAGADFGALAANTPHLVFDALRRRSPIPLISIVEVTCQAAKAGGIKRIGLLGTRFTMQTSFYPDVFTPAGITLVTPAASEQDYIHDKYMNELVNDIILPETRERMLTIIKRLKAEERIEAIILGGTELPLLLGGVTDKGIPFLDTTRLHCEQIVARMLSS